MKLIVKGSKKSVISYCYGCALQSINDCGKQCFSKG